MGKIKHTGHLFAAQVLSMRFEKYIPDIVSAWDAERKESFVNIMDYLIDTAKNNPKWESDANWVMWAMLAYAVCLVTMNEIDTAECTIDGTKLKLSPLEIVDRIVTWMRTAKFTPVILSGSILTSRTNNSHKEFKFCALTERPDGAKDNIHLSFTCALSGPPMGPSVKF